MSLKEVWTTLPIFKVNSGGDVLQTTLGIYDPHVFGHFKELGVQYERLGDTDSGVVWFKDQRLFSPTWGVDIQLWSTNRLRIKYFNQPEDPVVKTGFLQKRNQLFLSLRKEFSPYLNALFFYQLDNDRFSTEFTTTEVQNIVSVGGLPPETNVHFLGTTWNYGRVRVRDHLWDGSQFIGTFRYGLLEQDFVDDFFQLEAKWSYYKTIKSTGATFAQRLLLGATNTDVLQYWYYLGGLDRVRGFVDNRFSGRYFWLSNTEWRQPVFQNKYAVIQGVGFVDVVGTAEKFSRISDLTGASAGLGVRFIFPKVYRLILRADYAQPLRRDDDNRFSFGIQHFF